MAGAPAPLLPVDNPALGWMGAGKVMEMMEQQRTIADIDGIREILATARVIAVVGLSANWWRPSFFAAKYLQDHGYRVIPVNPNYHEILGQKCYPALEEIPDKVDVVDVFQRPEVTPPIARSAVAVGAKVLWLQLGVVNEEAAAIAQQDGLAVVMDRCMKIEHGRLLGGLNLFGVATGVISARRPKWLVY